MKKLALLLVVVFCSLHVGAEPQNGVVYVKQGAAGSGTSWSDAMGDIQAAINLAKATSDARKDVWVAAGTYPLTTHINMQDSVNVYGGFAGTETSVDERAKAAGAKAWEFSTPSILKGDGCRPVNFPAVSDIPTAIDGFTITDGNGLSNAGASDHNAGGVMLRHNGVITNCIVSNCATTGAGGGIFLNSGGVVRGCLVKGNRQTSSGNGGGGIFCNTSSTGYKATIEDSEITGNYSSIRGAGIGIQGNTTTFVRNNRIYNNVAKEGTATKHGGGIFMNSPNNEVVNNIIYNNSGSNAVYLQAGKFAGNTVVKNAGGIYLAAGNTAGQVINNIIWGCYTSAEGTTTTSLAGVAVSGLPVQNNAVYNPVPEDKSWALSGNIRFSSNASNGDIDQPAEGTVGSGPKFSKVTTSIGAIDTIGNPLPAEDYNILLADLEAADWSLLSASPCVDAGQNVDIQTSDIFGTARPQGFPFADAKSDIGAYELPYYSVAFDAYNKTEGMIYGEDGSAVLTKDTVLAFAAGRNALFYFMPALPHKAYITASTNGGLTYIGAKTDITSEIDPIDQSWKTQVTFPFQISVEWTPVSSALNEVAATQISCTGGDRAITVSGAARGESILIYHAGGALIRRMQATGDRMSISVPGGMYIVRAGDIARKVVVK
ncbi:MAG: right-handed parallel beta-helix repeat-containing protein [Tannerella sp.]|jgi:hypothetical protein|nr:right-handed parallel beta-helix repeat-containing protein [Tannerella sp.]